jgi:hypothetical protein
MDTDDLVRELETLAGPEPAGDDAWLSTMRRARRRRRSGRLAAGVAVLIVVGGVAFVSTVASDDPSTTVSSGAPASKSKAFYKATTTLIVDLSQHKGEPSGGFQNLAQVALFTTRGDVPDAVAEKLGGDETGRQLARRVTTKTDRRTSAIAITAVARTAEEAAQLADAFGVELVSVLDQKGQDTHARALDQLQNRLDELTNASNTLLPQIAANPPDVMQLRSQLDAIYNQYRSTYESFTQLTAQGPSTSRFTTLEKARAVRIDKAEYDERRHSGAA